MKVIAVTQVRINSSRLPRKALLDVGEDTLLALHLHRISKSTLVDQVIVTTTRESADDVIEELAAKENVLCYRGSTDNVLDRFYQSVVALDPKWVVRLTADCPLLDPELIDEVIDSAIKADVDYYSNILSETYPDGQDIEVIKFTALKRAWEESTTKSEKEHVTPFIKDNSDFVGKKMFTAQNHAYNDDYSHIRMTVDEAADYELIKKLVESLGTESTWLEYAEYIDNNQEVLELNSHIGRNEGYRKD